jgi:hypothetical protein
LIIQRLGMLVANKKRFFDILDSQDMSRLKELSTITGLVWHPEKNGIGTEKNNIEFIENFLNQNFRYAKEKGKLNDYFSAFKGVCLEARASNMQQYATSHPLPSQNAEFFTYETEIPVGGRDGAFEKALIYLSENEIDATKDNLIEILKKQDIFSTEFIREDGTRGKPTVEDLQNYILTAIEDGLIEEYPLDDFLEMEYDIFAESGDLKDEDHFVKHLQKRAGTNLGEVEFKGDEPEIYTFINALKQSDRLNK